MKVVLALSYCSLTGSVPGQTPASNLTELLLSRHYVSSNMIFYYIHANVSGRPSVLSKLIKDIPHEKISFLSTHEDIIFESIFVPLTAVKFVGVWSKPLWIFFGSLRKMFGNVCHACGQILENLQKSSENLQKHDYVLWACYITKRKLHGHLKIQNVSSHVEKYFTCLLCPLVKYMYFSALKVKFCMSALPCNTLYKQHARH